MKLAVYHLRIEVDAVVHRDTIQNFVGESAVLLAAVTRKYSIPVVGSAGAMLRGSVMHHRRPSTSI